jgi:L-ribulose-5-phosphate 3-epimerase
MPNHTTVHTAKRMTNRFTTATDRLAVCSWSLQPSSPQDLVSKLQSTGIRRVQLALDHLPDQWESTLALLGENDINIVSGMFGCIGEDYSTLETIASTGGIAPDGTWEQNLKKVHTTIATAAKLGLKLVTFHAGFVPHDELDGNLAKMLKRLRSIAALFAEKNIQLGLETGQETAPALATLLKKLDCPNVGVNFDPANMILYAKGYPVEALRLLAPWIRQVHIKDATRTQVPGTWGQEVAVGDGEVDWRAFFGTLKEFHFAGNIVIEREAGSQRVADIRKAREVVEKYLS